MPRHNIYFSDETLWERVQQAARELSAEQGANISASEVLARAAEAFLKRRDQQHD